MHDHTSKQWQSILETTKTGNPDLYSLASMLANRSPFSRLFPFLSLDALGFSRTEGYPFSADLPVVVYVGANNFQVRSVDGTVLGEGDLSSIIGVLLMSMPVDCRG